MAFPSRHWGLQMSRSRPEPGDLLIFNSRKMHAVSPGTGRSRLAVSCFVGYRGKQQALTYWS